MSRERWFRRGDPASFDGSHLARELDVPSDVARALYVRATRLAVDEADAEQLYLRYLRDAAPARRSAAAQLPVPGRTTRVMSEGSPPPLREVGHLAPGRWTRVLLEHGAGDSRLPGFDEVQAAMGALASSAAGEALPADLATRLAPHVGREAAGAARVHVDDTADRIAAEHHARALTVGDDIYFARGEYAPGTERGDELLVHELTHVAQARRGELTRAAAKGLASGGTLDPAEAEADLRAKLAVIQLHAPEAAGPPLAAPSGQPTSDGDRQAKLAAQQQRLSLADQAATPLAVPPAPPVTSPQAPVPHPPPKLAAPPTPAPTGNAYVDTLQAAPSRQGLELWARTGTQATTQAAADQARFDSALPPMPVVLDGGEAKAARRSAAAAHTPAQPPPAGAPPPAAQPTPTPAPPTVTAGATAAKAIQPTADRAQIKADGQKVLDSLPTTAPDVKTDPGPAPVTDLAGQADPVRSLADQQHAVGEGAKALDDAKTKVLTGPGAAQVQPARLDEKLNVPKEQAAGPMPALPTVDGMTKLKQWNLPGNALAAFDTVGRPKMDASLAAARAQMTQADGRRDADRTRAVTDAQDKVKAAHADADKQQQAKVAETRTQIANHQADTLVKQEAEVKKLDQQSGDRKKTTIGKINDRISADQAKVETDYKTAQSKAEAQKKQGEADAARKKQEAQNKQKDESWWDQAADALCNDIKAIVDDIDQALDAIGKAIGQLLDQVKTAACQVIDAARDFVCQALTEFGDWLKSAVTQLIGSVFPELAAALNQLIDQAIDAAKAAVTAIASGLKQAVTALCDSLKASLDAAIAAFKAAVQAAATLAQAAVTGNWALVGKMILDGILNALGIDPAAFYALIGEAQDSIEKIIANPGAFVGHLIDAVKLGFKQFGANFWTHLKDGLVQWLFGTFASAGITMPASFDIAGIFDLVCQILGLTWPRLRGKVVKLIGEKNTERLEFVAQYVQALITGGFAGLWAKIQQDLSNLWDMVVGGIRDWLIQSVVMAAIEKIATMWNPAGAIFELIKTAWNVYQWVRDNAQRIFGLVQAVVHSISNIVAGNIGSAANFIEASLAKLVPIAISLFADLLGLGGLADKIREIIEKVQEKIDHAIDKLIDRVMKLFKGKGNPQGPDNDPRSAKSQADDNGPRNPHRRPDNNDPHTYNHDDDDSDPKKYEDDDEEDSLAAKEARLAKAVEEVEGLARGKRHLGLILRMRLAGIRRKYRLTELSARKQGGETESFHVTAVINPRREFELYSLKDHADAFRKQLNDAWPDQQNKLEEDTRHTHPTKLYLQQRNSEVTEIEKWVERLLADFKDQTKKPYAAHWIKLSDRVVLMLKDAENDPNPAPVGAFVVQITESDFVPIGKPDGAKHTIYHRQIDSQTQYVDPEIQNVDPETQYVRDAMGQYVIRYVVRNITSEDLENWNNEKPMLPRGGMRASGNVTPLRHSQGHSRSPYIATTKQQDGKVCLPNGTSFENQDLPDGFRRAKIDLGQIDPSDIIDVSTPRASHEWEFDRAAVSAQNKPEKPEQAYRDVVRTSEVIIKGKIPADAIIDFLS